MTTNTQRDRQHLAAQAAAAAATTRRTRRVAVQIGAAVVVATALLLFAFTRNSGTKKHTYAIGPTPAGSIAPPIRLASTQGATFDLAAERGKSVLLYFQEGLGCQPCWDQIRDIEANANVFKAAGIDEVVSIAGNKLDQLRQKVEDEELHTTVLADPTLSLAATYKANQYGMMGTSAYGHTFILVGADGIVRWRADYGGSPNYTMYVKPADVLKDLAAAQTKLAS